MKSIWGILGLIAIIVLIFGGWYVGQLNYVVKLDEEVKSAWAQVENQLQRRYDLIPNLVEMVKGYVKQEKDLLTEVTRLRSQWGQAQSIPEKIQNAQDTTGVLSRLLLVSENYPDLKSNQNFLSLQAQLEGTENRIAVERMRYNEIVKQFNAYQRSVFGNFIAKQRGLDKPAPYFQVAEEAKQAPKVQF